ncbi:MAG: hypothetical protein JO053_02110 [Acidobacteria bacterium]|nr:hypothetical protein [Acidobacteriota bacterium]
MNIRVLVGILIGVGVLLLAFGVYLVVRTTSNVPGTTANNANTVNAASTPNDIQTITFDARNGGWRSIGNGPFTVSASGIIDYGGEKATPDNSPRMGDKTAPLAGVPFGVLIGRVGNGKPIKVGSFYRFDTTETVYLAINDSDYSDNSGSYTITIKK